MKILLTGASGFLGHYLLVELRSRGLAVLTAGRSGAQVTMDLADAASVARALATSGAEAVLHAGALSRLAACERNEALAMAVNARASGILARGVAGRCVLVSTDLVFDGTAAPYAATAAPAPRSAYGRSKAAGELEVLAAAGIVARVPLLFGRSFDGQRGASDMLRGAVDREVGLFTNEFRTPLHAADAARGLVDLVVGGGGGGVVHLPGPERVSRWEFAQRFVAVHGLRELRLRPEASADRLRPEDVSLAGPWSCGRSLQVALADA